MVWKIGVAVLAVALLVLRGIKVIPWKFTAPYVIGLFCFWTLLALQTAVPPGTFLGAAGIFLLAVVAGLVFSDVTLEFFSKLRGVLRARFGKKSPLPPYAQEICRAVEHLAKKRIGGLMVVERTEGLEKYLLGRTPFDADVKGEILTALFAPASPVHDGAVVIAAGRIRYVKGVLPILTQASVPLGVGTRHRAAIGVTEKTDAVAAVVSEERGEMSVVYRGKITAAKSPEEFAGYLATALKGRPPASAANAS